MIIVSQKHRHKPSSGHEWVQVTRENCTLLLDWLLLPPLTGSMIQRDLITLTGSVQGCAGWCVLFTTFTTTIPVKQHQSNQMWVPYQCNTMMVSIFNEHIEYSLILCIYAKAPPQPQWNHIVQMNTLATTYRKVARNCLLTKMWRTNAKAQKPWNKTNLASYMV